MSSDPYIDLEGYVRDGFSYNEILGFLSINGVNISKRTLHRVLRERNLYRRRRHNSVNSVLENVKTLLLGSGRCFGYRLMHQKLRSRGINTDRETVRLCLKSLDEEFVSLRKKHQFQRRKYVAKGPNYVWHLDGYDKLKPFGFAIHGAIDGWSRKILWLYVGSSNNDPSFISTLYLQSVENLKILPRCVRTDRGTENVIICGCQRFFRRNFTDSASGQHSFQYGPSTRNQRIESWWSIFRRNRANWWINFFKDFCEAGFYDPSIPLHIECARFCFMGLIQTELDETVKLWNCHYIRKTRGSECPPGRPDALFAMPERSGGTDCKFEINQRDIECAKSFSKTLPLISCSEDSFREFSAVMREKNLGFPTDVELAKTLFQEIVNTL